MFRFNPALLAAALTRAPGQSLPGMMGSAIHALIAATERKRSMPRHMTGRGRAGIYTWHHGPNGGSHPVPGGGSRECARRRLRMEAANVPG